MKFSVAYTFEPGIISRLAMYPQVTEVFGKLDKDIIGGGRSTKLSRRSAFKEGKRVCKSRIQREFAPAGCACCTNKKRTRYELCRADANN